MSPMFCLLQAVKGPRGLKERPRRSPSKERGEKKGPLASTAFLDHEVRAVTVESQPLRTLISSRVKLNSIPKPVSYQSMFR